MNSALYSDADRHFQHCLGVGLDALLAPISAGSPCGEPARRCPSYAALREARRQDDPSLPLGAWERELKRADWGAVSHLVGHALQRESKDMQLLAWLFEAQIKQHGIAGIAPTLTLVRELCTRYWDEIHPSVADGDVEHRANIVGAIAEKNLPAIRLAPLIGIEDTQPHCWADWEQAHLNEQIRSVQSKANLELDGITLQALQSELANASTEGFVELRTNLLAGLQAIGELSAALDPLFGDQAPSFSNMTRLLEQMHSLVDGELHKRGVRAQGAVHEESAPQAEAVAGNGSENESATMPEQHAVSGAIRDRADAYARLAETAEFLMRLEPHSPVPYLVRRATEWGRLNTVELYQELFLRLGGQLNIFEVLGLQEAQTRIQNQ
ncbi:type VI secretion system protein TssA [Trinickia dinghuensis]|uniref:Type VI secretion system protein TssA n=1 Tax=Trinickia dinghuensis TaxID=2291023 RepID=A0A3D8JNP4_9BURK|nr:type VI secretion system protein TssA [Trinickia dinghuensis]RDU94729.1 type VI secretion system protein TssA [Trinickia dinghuensis]